MCFVPFLSFFSSFLGTREKELISGFQGLTKPHIDIPNMWSIQTIWSAHRNGSFEKQRGVKWCWFRNYRLCLVLQHFILTRSRFYRGFGFGVGAGVGVNNCLKCNDISIDCPLIYFELIFAFFFFRPPKIQPLINFNYTFKKLFFFSC